METDRAALHVEEVRDLASESEIPTGMIAAATFMRFAQVRRATAGMVAVGRQSLCSCYQAAEQGCCGATQPNENT